MMAPPVRRGSASTLVRSGVFVLALFAAGPAFAQQTGTLAGVVHDAQGGVLPGVTVTASGEALIGGSRTTVSGDAGAYQFALPPVAPRSVPDRRAQSRRLAGHRRQPHPQLRRQGVVADDAGPELRGAVQPRARPAAGARRALRPRGHRFKIGTSSVEPVLDLFNVLNANHVLLQTEQIGTTWRRPTRILTPRIIRFGVTARF